MSSLPKSYKAAVFESAGAPVTLKTLELKPPGSKQILVKVIACGVCHSDDFVRQGLMGEVFPRIPGHEYIGDVAAVGDGVTKVSVGDRVGGPWHGGHDSTCRQCQRGFFQTCDHEVINGVSTDGGYAEYVLLREEATVRVPKEADPVESAPLLCAGITVFNGLRKLHVEQGNLVAVQGVGGLGHLAIQFASKMGYRTVAISSGQSKEDFARKLGAHEFIDTSKYDPVEKLNELGGAAAIIATAPNGKSFSPLISGLQPGGKLLVLAPVGPVDFDTAVLVSKAVSVHGWPSGHALDSEEAIGFAHAHGVKVLVETFPLDDVQKALDHCTSGKVRFRSVIVM